MITLKPITVSEYADLEDAQKKHYDFAMKYAFRFTDPDDEYNIGDMMEMPFGFVKDLQYEMEHGLTWNKLIDFALEATGRQSFADEPLEKLSRFLNYLKTSVEKIVENESLTLAHEPTDREASAGLDRFNELGVYMQIRSLTGGDVTKTDAVRKLPYSLCFTEMYAAKQLYEYNQALYANVKK